MSNIHQGDILIEDDVKKYLQWPLTQVIELIPGKDAEVRTVKLQTQACMLIHPVQHIFLLQVSGNDLSSLPLRKV